MLMVQRLVSQHVSGMPHCFGRGCTGVKLHPLANLCAIRPCTVTSTDALCSMSKLYDLSVTTLKQQISVSTKPAAALHIALVHLRCVRSLLGEHQPFADAQKQSAVPFLDQFKAKLNETYRTFSIGKWLGIRGQILSFLEDCRIKVRVMLLVLPSAT